MASPEIKEASRKAREFFLDSLSPEQLEQLYSKEEITVIGSNGREYILACQRRIVLNITSGGFRYCVSTINRQLPKWDIWLSQKLLIEHDENRFLELAKVQIDIAYPREGIEYGQYRG